MASHPRRTTLRVDGDGVRRLEARGVRMVVRLFALAVGLVSLGVVVAVVAIRLSDARRTEPVPAGPPARPVAGSSTPAREAATVAPAAPVPAAASVTPRRKRPAPAEPEGEEATFTLPAPGERTGIAVFPPPGTKPIKRGIVVPEGFELPPGYVRHHQTTDEGRPLPPILMFHPDFEFVDPRGEPVRVPEDRVVPPEMAPPGLPIQLLDVPDGREPSGTAP
jgi:hypothetical protein